MKIPFDIKLKPQIESGEYKVIDQFGYALTLKDIINDVWYFSLRYPNTDYETERIYDHPENHLFIITPEPELSEFERGYMRIVHRMVPEDFNDEGLKTAKEMAAELLELARKEIGQKVLTDKVFLSKTYADAYDAGRKDALKDLPRWRKANGKERFNERMIVFAHDNDLWCANYAEEGEYYLSFSDLVKLPGLNKTDK